MITAEQLKDVLERADALHRYLEIDKKKIEFEEEDLRTQAPDFWDDPKAAEKFLKELSGVKFWVTGYDKVASGVEDLNVLLEFEDEEIDQAYAAVVEEVEALELRNMLGEEGDNLGAVLTINSGAGGTESNDWSSMLMRMYIRWAERNGYKVTITDEPCRLRETMHSAISRRRAVCTVWSESLHSMPRESVRQPSRLSLCIHW